MRRFVIIINITALLTVIGLPKVHAQIRGRDTNSRSALARSIPASRMAKINTAFSYDHETYMKIVTDPSLNPVEKNLRLKEFMISRQRRIDSLVTPAEKAKIKILRANTLKQDSLKRQASFVKHTEKLNKVPHRTRAVGPGNKNSGVNHQ